MSYSQEGFKAALWRWRERWRARRSKKRPLREFVYLDETSVYSLYASRFGEIPSEKTETLTQVRQNEVGGSVGATTGAVKSGLTSRAMTSQSQQSQVVSRAIVQSTFKELLEKERSSLALSHVPEFKKTPSIENLDSLKSIERSNSRLRRLITKGFVIDPSRLVRGALLEIEVELNSEFIFQFSSVLQVLVGMAKNNPAIFGSDEEEISELNDISGIIEELLVGLIPLRGRAVDYMVMELDDPDGRRFVIHKRLLEGLKDRSGFTIYPLYIVGVAEEPLFWKDIRRVLFAGQRFTLLCRVAQDDVGTSWVPLKLQQVVSSLFPDLGEEIEKVNRGDLFKSDLDHTSAVNTFWKQTILNMLLTHARWIASSNDIELSDDDTANIASLAEEHGQSLNTEEERRVLFKRIEEYITDSYDLELDPEAAKESRQRVRQEAGVSQLAMSDPNQESFAENSDDRQTQDDVFFLDSEFIAIYW